MADRLLAANAVSDVACTRGCSASGRTGGDADPRCLPQISWVRTGGWATTAELPGRLRRPVEHAAEQNSVRLVATRHLGWRLIEVVREIPGLSYGAAALGIRQFWRLLPADPEKEAFRRALIHQILKL